MQPSHRRNFSDASFSSDRLSDGSAEDDPGNLEEFLDHYRCYARETSFQPQPTVGFGESRYGPRPEEIIVANTGPAAGARVVYRADLEPLYRWDARGAEIIFREGFRPWNDKLPSSLQYYQGEAPESALVSTTRDPNPAGAQPRDAFDENGFSYRYTIYAPGGYEFMTSLTHHGALYGQQEVAFWKGIRPEYIARLDVFDRNGQLRGISVNRNAYGANSVANERERRNQEVRALIVAERATTSTGQPQNNPHARHVWNTLPAGGVTQASNQSNQPHEQQQYHQHEQSRNSVRRPR